MQTGQETPKDRKPQPPTIEMRLTFDSNAAPDVYFNMVDAVLMLARRALAMPGVTASLTDPWAIISWAVRTGRGVDGPLRILFETGSLGSTTPPPGPRPRPDTLDAPASAFDHLTVSRADDLLGVPHMTEPAGGREFAALHNDSEGCWWRYGTGVMGDGWYRVTYPSLWNTAGGSSPARVRLDEDVPTDRTEVDERLTRAVSEYTRIAAAEVDPDAPIPTEVPSSLAAELNAAQGLIEITPGDFVTEPDSKE